MLDWALAGLKALGVVKPTVDLFSWCREKIHKQCDDDQIPLFQAATELFEAMENTRFGRLARHQGKSPDGIIITVCNYMAEVCTFYGAVTPSGNVRSLAKKPWLRLRVEGKTVLAQDDREQEIVHLGVTRGDLRDLTAKFKKRDLEENR